jgi:F-type H+-transporting ATPase subunit alpha
MPEPPEDIVQRLSRSLSSSGVSLAERIQPRGVVRRIGDGVAIVSGLDTVRFEELLAFDSGALGMAYDLRAEGVGAVLLSGANQVREGDGVVGSGRLPDLPVGPPALGRVLDPLGTPLDEGPSPTSGDRLPLFRPAPEIRDRCNITQTLWTGIMAIDAAIPIGRGQRELIIGDRNVGKTSLALDAIVAQQSGDVACVYVVIGQPMSRVLALRETLLRAGKLANTAIVAADASTSPGMQYLAPYAGASVAEWFRDRGRHALVIYDDLTKHADAYRELALLLDRPPGREAYPGDIFYVHAELLERAAALGPDLGGGSVTALPLAETTDGDISTYIPTNLISITDGQIYLDSARFERDQRPAIDIGRSVSRIGAVAQPKPLRAVAKNLRIQLARFESLEKLSRVGLDIDAATRASLNDGYLLRALLRQGRLSPRTITDQVIALLSVSEKWLKDVSPSQAKVVVDSLIAMVRHELPQLAAALDAGKMPPGDWKQQIAVLAAQAKLQVGK